MSGFTRVMNKTSKKQKGYKKKLDRIQNENSGDNKNPMHSSSDNALVKFDPLQRYLAEISKYKLLTREQEIELGALPDLPVKLMMNVGNPERAFDFAAIPNEGVGLAPFDNGEFEITVKRGG